MILRGMVKRLRGMNWWLTLSVAGLLAVGVLFIYSACHTRLDQAATLHKRQMVWALWGWLGYFGAALLDYRRVRDLAASFYVLSVGLLVAVLLVGTRIYGAQRWLMLFGVGIQPSEIAKLSFILASACLLVPAAGRFGRPPAWGWNLALAAVPMVLIMRQPDLGTALAFVPMALAMLFAGGVPLRPLVTLTLLGLIGAGLIVAAVVLPHRLGLPPERQEQIFRVVGLSAYQRERIETFLQPGKDPLGAGWNQRQSELAVGSGGLTGKGYRRGTQNVLGYLPKTVAPTDFIFSVIAEETGFMGAATVLALYAVLVFGGLYAAVVAPDRLGRVLCVGVVALLFTHVFVNIAMTVGLLPIVGLPLPLLSYGGTFMVCTMVGLGLVQSVYMRRRAV